MSTKANVVSVVGVVTKADFDLPRQIEQGLPAEIIQNLNEAGLTLAEVADLIISPQTLKHRNARGEKLTHEEVDRVVRVARILSLAEAVFGNKEKAFLWLRTPTERLENRSPLNVLKTESGGQLVEHLLWQIDEGIYS